MEAQVQEGQAGTEEGSGARAKPRKLKLEVLVPFGRAQSDRRLLSPTNIYFHYHERSVFDTFYLTLDT